MGKKKDKIPPPGNKKDEYTNFMNKKKWKQALAKAYIDLNGRNLRPMGATIVGNVLVKNKTLTNIDLAHNNIGDEGATMFAQYMKVNELLQRVNLGCNGITDVGAIALASAFVPYANPTGQPSQWNRMIDVLLLVGNLISDDGMHALCMAAACNTEMRLIDLTYNKVHGFGCKGMYRALERNHYLNIKLAENEIGDEGAAFYCGALKRFNSAISLVNLCRNEISKLGAEAVGELLESNNTIGRVNLAGNTLGQPGAEVLVKHLVPPNTHIVTELNLHDNKIGGGSDGDVAGATEIARLIEADCPTLGRLIISQNELSDAGGAIIFNAVAKSTNLRYIYASHNDFGAKTATAICNAIRAQRDLKMIDVSHCSRFKVGSVQAMNATREEVYEVMRKEREARIAEEAAAAAARGEKYEKPKLSSDTVSLNVSMPTDDDVFDNFLEKTKTYMDRLAEEEAAKAAKKNGKKSKKKSKK